MYSPINIDTYLQLKTAWNKKFLSLIRKPKGKDISPNLLRVILFLICCTTEFSIGFVCKIWSE